ncbi:TPA: hypothetical protein SMO99_003067 [Proteus mirabilis]|uniref:Uncharacterized protein n=3 Tax=Morganellaceae TaxID=1903414 RepID=A0AAI9HS24_MORMO|nr:MULTISPECIES: hypothetical protein [Providencia]EJV1664215.1 hypothetical protein [Klebsiella pneumoniae]EKW8761362.1 hypothetical protein [Morganella morganii]HEJ9425027.1 hypothetical protein [Proteus mirabilis]ELI9034732.1 hypothetical protein [Morganella morganii]ELR5252369.1 hypothetical protein [Providencia rettgeri]
MSACALIEYNNASAKLRGVVVPGDEACVKYALSRWAVIAFRIRNTDDKFTRIPVEDWIEGIQATVSPSPARERILAALARCKPGIF